MGQESSSETVTDAPEETQNQRRSNRHAGKKRKRYSHEFDECVGYNAS